MTKNVHSIIKAKKKRKKKNWKEFEKTSYRNTKFQYIFSNTLVKNFYQRNFLPMELFADKVFTDKATTVWKLIFHLTRFFQKLIKLLRWSLFFKTIFNSEFFGKIANGFQLHFNCLTGFWIRLWLWLLFFTKLYIITMCYVSKSL